MADAVLHVKVDPSGAVVGSTAASVSLDKLSAAAARSNAATNMLTSAFTSSNVAARNVEVSLRSMLREQTGLARAYAAGSDAVKQYNLQLKIESVLAEAGVAANTMRGRAIAAQVAQLDQLIAANQAAALAQREADAAAGSAKGGLSGLMGAAFGAAAAFAVLKSAVTDFAHAALEAEDAERRLASAVERRGSAFKLTTADLVSMASKLESVTAFEDDAIQKAQAVLLRFDEIDSTNIEAVTKATLDFAEATGQDAVSAATSFGKALLVPGEAMRALKEVGVTLTQQQQDMVDAWNSSGQGAKSVSLLVGMLNDKIGGEAEKAALTGAGGLKQFNAQVGNLKEVLGAGLIPDLSAATEVIGALAKVLGSGKFSMANLLTPSSAFLKELNNIHEAKLAADALSLSLKLVGDNGRHVKEEQPFIKPKTKEEIEAAKRAAEEYAAKLQAIVDKADPFGAKQREMAANVKLLKEAFKVLKIPVAEQPAMIARLTGEWAGVGEKLRDVELQAIDTAGALGKMREIKAPEVKGSMIIEHVEIPETAYEAANARFSDNLRDGVSSAFTDALMSFATGGKDVMKNLGQALKAALLNAAAEYLKAMLDAAMKSAMAQRSGALPAGQAGPTQSTGSSAMAAAGSVMTAVAVAYAVIEITKAIKAANDAGKFKETAAAGVYRGGVGSTYAGELSEQGRQMATSLRDFLNLMQSVAGQWITQLPEIGVRVSGDGKKFLAMVGGEIVGTYKSMSEAMVRSFQAAFSKGTFASEINPIIRDMVTNFRGSNIEELKAGLIQVRQMLDQVSGLSDVEIAIRDLPFQADALRQKMVDLGASFIDASNLAAKWQATQMQSLRDQITGHQATEAEQRAQKEREALLFNAQLALNKAEIMMKRDKLAADIEILKAGGSLALADLNFTTQYLGQVGRLTEVKAELLNQDIQIQQGHVNLMTAAGQAALASLQLHLDALNQVYAILDSIKPINLGEIRIGGGGHGGGGNVNVNAGPSEAEQRARSFAEFIEQMRLDGLSNYQRALAELDAAFAEQAQAAGEAAGGEKALIAARVAATARLRENLIDQMGLPMEAVRDRFAQMQQQAADFYASNVELQRQFDAGEISIEEFTAAVQRSQQIQRELRNQALSDVASMALYFTDALGFDEESAQIRQVLAQLEWEFKLAEFKLAVEQYYLMKRLTDEQYAYLNDLIDRATNAGPPPPPPPPPPPRDQNSGANDARDEALNNLTRALDRLRSIVQTYTDFLRGLQTSESSPYSIEQQYNTAQAEYQRLLALAQAGNLDAIEALPNAAQTYLDLAAQMFGTASAGYAQIFEGINTDMSDILGGVQSILDSVPTQFRPMEERLDTIAEILQNMYLLQGGTAGTGGGANPHAGLVYYGPEWGWHPMGWSPGGNTPPSTGNFAANAASPSLTNANGVGQPLAETNRHLQVIAAQQARAAKLQASDRYRKPKLSYAGYAGGRSAGERKS